MNPLDRSCLPCVTYREIALRIGLPVTPGDEMFTISRIDQMLLVERIAREHQDAPAEAPEGY